MKILMLIPLFFPHIGGVEKHTIEVSKLLSKQGHKIYIITKRYEKKLKKVEKIGETIIIRIPNKRFFGIWINLLKYKSLFKKCDIIHCHDFNTFYWYLPFILINSNLYITFHGFEKYPIPKIYTILRKVAEIFTKGNICVGKFITKYYRTKPTFITYGGVNLSEKYEINKKIPKKLNSALFIGRLEPDTGILEYIRAIKILKYKFKIDISLEICGDGKLRSIIEEYSEKNRLTIRINGFVRNLNDYYNKNGIILCSSYLCILESLYRKKLVISIYQNELKKDYLQNSPFIDYILISKNSNEIAKNVKKFLESDKEIYTRIRNGFEFALKNDWSRIISIYIKLWKHFY